jgi:hypothetical protein
MMLPSFGRDTGGWLNFSKCDAITPRSSGQRVSRETWNAQHHLQLGGGGRCCKAQKQGLANH